MPEYWGILQLFVHINIYFILIIRYQFNIKQEPNIGCALSMHMKPFIRSWTTLFWLPSYLPPPPSPSTLSVSVRAKSAMAMSQCLQRNCIQWPNRIGICLPLTTGHGAACPFSHSQFFIRSFGCMRRNQPALSICGYENDNRVCQIEFGNSNTSR